MPTEHAQKTSSAVLENLRHDLRTSLLGVLGLAEVLHEALKNTAAATQSGALVSSIATCLDFQTQMLDELIEKKPLQNTYCLKAIVEKAIKLAKPRALLKNLPIDFEWDPILPTCVLGNELFLFRIMHELLTNAIKFTDKGKISIRFNLLDKQHRHFFLCGEVSDTGSGIADNEKAAVFQRFYRIPSDESGSGIGLSNVQQMIHTLNGQCEIKSIEGQGTGFFFHIPMIEVDEIGVKLTDKKMESVMHQLLLQHLPKDYLTIEQAFQKKEWLTLHKANHALLGALLYCDVPQLKLASIELQKALQHDNHSKIIRCAKNLLIEIKNLIAHAD